MRWELERWEGVEYLRLENGVQLVVYYAGCEKEDAVVTVTAIRTDEGIAAVARVQALWVGAAAERLSGATPLPDREGWYLVELGAGVQVTVHQSASAIFLADSGSGGSK